MPPDLCNDGVNIEALVSEQVILPPEAANYLGFLDDIIRSLFSDKYF